jgi:hypothetical protein
MALILLSALEVATYLDMLAERGYDPVSVCPYREELKLATVVDLNFTRLEFLVTNG